MRNLVQTLDDPEAVLQLSCSQYKVAECQANPPMPPLEAVVAVLRWIKGWLLATNGCLVFTDMRY